MQMHKVPNPDYKNNVKFCYYLQLVKQFNISIQFLSVICYSSIASPLDL